MKKLPRPRYRCLGCKGVFSAKEPPDLGVECPKCEGLYLHWINAALWIKRVDWQLENYDAS